jgi:WhiB family redox-sensing transcriptional regulator
VDDTLAAYAVLMTYAHDDPAYLEALAWLEPPAWHADAACREHPTELFFPERGDNATGDAARAVCAGCLVHDECRAFALADSSLRGIWGGLTGLDRRLLRRRTAAA